MFHPAHYAAREKPPIDPATREYWDAAENGTITLISGLVDTWKGALTGLYSLPAPSAGARPNYLSDPALFGTVVQSSSTGSKCVANTALSTIVANGTRPYLISAFRLHAVPGVSALYGIIGFGILATSDPLYLNYQTFGGSELRPQIAGINVFATATSDTLKHVVECWLDGVNANCRDNGTLFTAANTGSISGTLNAIGIGRAASTNTHFANCNHAFHMICASKPSDAFITRLKLWLHYNKGITIPVPPQTPPLPSTAVAAWHSEINCTATAWVDYIGGRSIAGQNTPVVATDPGFFNGKVVAKATQSTTSSWFGGSFTGLPLTGSRPWGYLVARMRTATPPGTQGMCGAGGSGSGNPQGGIAGFSTNYIYQSHNPVANLAGSTINTAVHRFKAWKDTTNKNFQVDNTAFTVAEPGATLADITAIGIGGFHLGGSVADANIAFFLLCSAKPTADEEAALDAWAQNYFAAP